VLCTPGFFWLAGLCGCPLRRPTQLPTQPAHSTDPFVRISWIPTPDRCSHLTPHPQPHPPPGLPCWRRSGGESMGAGEATALTRGWDRRQLKPSSPVALAGRLRARGVSGVGNWRHGPGAAPGTWPWPAAALAAPAVDTVAPGVMGRAASTSSPPWPLWPPLQVPAYGQARQSRVPAAGGSADVLEALVSTQSSRPVRAGSGPCRSGLHFLVAPGWHRGPGGPRSAAPAPGRAHGVQNLLAFHWQIACCPSPGVACGPGLDLA